MTEVAEFEAPAIHQERPAQAFGIEFTRATSAELVGEICNDVPVKGMGVRLMVTTNLDHVVKLRNNARFREAYDRAWCATIDGAPVFVYAKLRGLSVPERVTGADLFPLIMEELDPSRHRPFFVAPSEEVAVRLSKWLVARGFKPNTVAAATPAFGFERDEIRSAALADQIRKHGTTHLFFGVGCPKSEIWIDQHRLELGDTLAFAFGAGLEFFVGASVRAPKILQKIGLEWAWRVSQDPRRLFKRYFIDSWGFLLSVRDDLSSARGRTTVSSGSPS